MMLNRWFVNACIIMQSCGLENVKPAIDYEKYSCLFKTSRSEKITLLIFSRLILQKMIVKFELSHQKKFELGHQKKFELGHQKKF